MPLLQEWRIVMSEKYSAKVLQGEVFDHPKIPDGHKVSTTPIVRIDENKTWANTWNRHYVLGSPHADMEPDGDANAKVPQPEQELVLT